MLLVMSVDTSLKSWRIVRPTDFSGCLMWSIFGEALSKQKTALEAAQARTWFHMVDTVYTGTGPQMTWGNVLEEEKWWNLARDTGESIWPSSVNRGAPQHFTTSKHRGSSNAGAAWCMAGPGLPQQICIKWHLPIPAFYECKDQNSVHRSFQVRF